MSASKKPSTPAYAPDRAGRAAGAGRVTAGAGLGSRAEAAQ
ncbi:hypothetical protein [Nocardia paucivorans]|nr:hypothetical protein [Nocardia paucivorans]